MKIGFLSLGCPKNLVDSEVMLGLAREAGHDITADAREAEVLVVNTCAFIDSAKQESVDAILEMAELKKTGACKRLVVTGCLAERYREQLRAEMPEIDAVLGTGEVPGIVTALEGNTPPAGDAVPLTFHRSGLGARVSGLDHAPVARDVESRAPSPEPRGLPTYLYDADTPRTLVTP